MLYVCRSEEAREGIIPSEAGGVIGSCKLPSVVLETRLRSSAVTLLTTGHPAGPHMEHFVNSSSQETEARKSPNSGVT